MNHKNGLQMIQPIKDRTAGWNKFIRTKMRPKEGTKIELRRERFVRFCQICQICGFRFVRFVRFANFRDLKKRETDHGRTDGRMDGQTDGRTDGRTDLAGWASALVGWDSGLAG